MNWMLLDVPRMSGRPSTSSDEGEHDHRRVEQRRPHQRDGHGPQRAQRRGAGAAGRDLQRRVLRARSAARANRYTTGAATPMATIAMPGTRVQVPEDRQRRVLLDPAGDVAAGAYIAVQPSSSGSPGIMTGTSRALRKKPLAGRSVRVSSTAMAVPSTTEPTVVSTANTTLLRDRLPPLPVPQEVR